MVAATCAADDAPALYADILPVDSLPQKALLDHRLLSVPSAAQFCTVYVETPAGRAFGDKAQKKASALIDEHQLKGLAASADVLELTRLRSCARPFASSWVAPINAAVGTPLALMESADFVTAVSLRLGLPVVETPASCVCGAEMDQLGHHALCCTRSNRHAVHNAVRLAIVNLASKALCRPLPEAKPFAMPHGGLRVDVLLRDNVGEKPVALDVTVVTPFSRFTSVDTAEGDTRAVKLAEKMKHSKYDEACGDTIRFIPLAVDALGAWSDSAIALFKRLARLAGRREDMHPSQAIPLELQRVALTLQLGVARLVRLSVAGSTAELDTPASISAPPATSSPGAPTPVAPSPAAPPRAGPSPVASSPPRFRVKASAVPCARAPSLPAAQPAGLPGDCVPNLKNNNNNITQCVNCIDAQYSPVSLLPSAAAADAPVVVEVGLPAGEQREVPVFTG